MDETRRVGVIVVVPSHADFAWFVSGTECFFVQEQGFFPEGAFGGENAGWKARTHCQLREDFGKICKEGKNEVAQP
jgi:hypothetical protein